MVRCAVLLLCITTDEITISQDAVQNKERERWGCILKPMAKQAECRRMMVTVGCERVWEGRRGKQGRESVCLCVCGGVLIR